jgi:hypothetical protein
VPPAASRLPEPETTYARASDPTARDDRNLVAISGVRQPV